MKFTLIYITLIYLSVVCLSAQSISGVITDPDGAPVPYATVFVKTTGIGLFADENGNYSVSIEEGTNELSFRSLGFSSVNSEVLYEGADLVLDVTLPFSITSLNEVIVTSNGEDPAYSIVRKAIGLSTMHLNLVQHYEADVYMKATIRVDKIPSLIAGQLRRSEGIEVKSGDVFFNETYSKVSFDSPGIFNQEIVAMNVSLPNVDQIPVMEYLNGSVYQPKLHDDMLSPLSTMAFTHYRYKYQGSSRDGIYTVYKIEVVPKRESKKLFRGTIYIIDELWCLHSVDLKFNTRFGEVGMEQIFDMVSKDVWYPVSHIYNFDGGALGVKAGFNYRASLSYNNIKVDSDFIGIDDSDLIQEKRMLDSVKGSSIVSLRKQFTDQSLSKSEMKRIAKAIESKVEDKHEENFAMESGYSSKISVISSAPLQDSSYWSAIRPEELSEIEMKGADNVKDFTKIYRSGFSVSESEFVNSLFYSEWRLNDYSFRYTGLLNLSKISFNPVSGFKYGVSFRYRRKNSFKFDYDIKYGFSSKRFDNRLGFETPYAGKRRGYLTVKLSSLDLDFNSRYLISPEANSVTSILLKDNYIKSYREQKIFVENRIDISNGLELKGSVGWRELSELENSSDLSLFNGKDSYSPNIIEDYDGPVEGKELSATVSVRYTPKSYYEMTKGRKRYIRSDFPSFMLEYSRGAPINKEYIGDYQRWSFSIDQEIVNDMDSKLFYKFSTGVFSQLNSAPFSALFLTGANPLPIKFNDRRDIFYNMDNYSYFTDDLFLEGHVDWSSSYIALKFIPIFSNSYFKERIWTGFRYLSDRSRYVEFGYGLNDIYYVGGLNTAVSFDRDGFDKLSVALTIKI